MAMQASEPCAAGSLVYEQRRKECKLELQSAQTVQPGEGASAQKQHNLNTESHCTRTGMGEVSGND